MTNKDYVELNAFLMMKTDALTRIRAMAEVSYEKTACKMRIAGRIADVMAVRGVNRKELADRMGKRPSEITKWLSGTHNFTLDTLAEISSALSSDVLEPGSAGSRVVPVGGIASWGRIALNDTKK